MVVATAANGTVGYWPEASDVVASDPSKTGGSLISPPSGWPKSFSENATLKALMGKKQLAGKRCRLTGLPSKDDMAKCGGVEIDTEDSFGNSERVQQATGWTVIKGFAVFEIGGANSFVGHKRWWVQKDSGVWVDPTPRPEGVVDMVLLESALSTKSSTALTDAVRSAAAARVALGGFAKPAAASSSPKPAAASTPKSSSKPKPKPPPSPAKLEFKGSESLEELIALLTKGTPQAQTRAAAAIAAQAASGPNESKRVVAANGLTPLLLLLRRDGEVQDHAARAVMSLADCMDHQQLITNAGAIPAVVQLLSSAPSTVQDTAAGILGNLAIQNPSNQQAIVSAGALPHLVHLLLKGSSPAKEQACFALWNLACQNSENQMAIEQAGGIKPLVALLSKGAASLQEEAAGALMNLAAHPENKRVIAAAGAIDSLVTMLGAGGGPAEQAAGALMNLASNNSANQSLIQKANALGPLMGVLKDKSGASRRAREYVAGALMNLTLKQPSMQAEVAKAGAIPLLVEMLGEAGGQMEEVAGALTNLADSNEDNQLEAAKAGAIGPLVKLISAAAPQSCQEEAAGTLMNLSAHDANKPKVVAAGAVGPLVALLGAATDATKEHAAGALANLANGRDENQAAVTKAGAVEPLLALLSSTGGGEPGGAGGIAARAASALLLLSLKKEGAELVQKAGGVKKLAAALARGVSEAAGALMNLALTSADSQAAIISEGCVPHLVAMLSSGSPAGQEEAAGALMNLVTDSPKNQKAVAAAGAVLPLVMLLSFGGTAAAKEQAAAALGNLAHKNEANRKAIVAAQACPALLELLRSEAKAEKAGPKKVDKASAKAKTTGGGRVEAANCLRVLIEADVPLQTELVEDGLLPLLKPVLADKASEEAANKLLGAFDECFEDLIATQAK